MRNINVKDISKCIQEMCIESAYNLSGDMCDALHNAFINEDDALGKQVLDSLLQNLQIAKKENIPICQDTGMVIVFLKIGQDVYIEGGNLNDAINEGVAKGYIEGYLRKSVVSDPINRVNTKDNTPAIIHYDIVDGDIFEITLCLKGAGSENQSKLFMLKPADGIEGIKKVVIDTVKNAGGCACPPIVVGIGVGGNLEKAAIMSKHALTRNINESSSLAHIKELEEELLQEINETGIGPSGLGGKITALKVNIETYPTHIAQLPVCVNLCCHANRHSKRSL